MEKSQNKQTLKELLFEILRFLIVGGVATLVDYAVFWLFDGVLFPLFIPSTKVWEVIALIIATALGFCAGLIINWVLSIKFVYKAVSDPEKAQSKKSFVTFTIIGIIGLIITEVGILGLVAIFPSIKLFGVVELFGTSWEKWIAKIIMTCIVLMWNYVGRKILIFK